MNNYQYYMCDPIVIIIIDIINMKFYNKKLLISRKNIKKTDEL